MKNYFFDGTQKRFLFYSKTKNSCLAGESKTFKPNARGKITLNRKVYLSESCFTNLIQDNNKEVRILDFQKNLIAKYDNLEDFKKSKNKNLIYNEVIDLATKDSKNIRLFIPYPFCKPFWDFKSENKQSIKENKTIVLLVSQSGWPLFFLEENFVDESSMVKEQIENGGGKWQLNEAIEEIGYKNTRELSYFYSDEYQQTIDDIDVSGEYRENIRVFNGYEDLSETEKQESF